MIDINNDFNPKNETFLNEEEQIRIKVIDIVKKLSEEDLLFLLEILQYSLRT